MKIYSIVDDDVHEISLEDAHKLKKSVWIRSIKPEKDEIQILSEISTAHVDDFKEFMEEDERPRLVVQKYLQVIYRVPHKEDNEVRTEPINIYVFKNFIISVEKEHTNVLDKIENLILAKRARFLFRSNPYRILTYLLDKVNDSFVTYVDSISESLEISQSHTALQKGETADKIYSTSITLSFFNQALLANTEVLNALRKTYARYISQKEKDQFSELYFDALQILDREKIQREVITNLFNLQSVIASNRLNNFIKRLTVLAVIIAIPTLISGIYGMNFEHIPFSGYRNGFYIVIFLMFIITGLLVYFIRKID